MSRLGQVERPSSSGSTAAATMSGVQRCPRRWRKRNPELVGPASRAAAAIDRGDQLVAGKLGEPLPRRPAGQVASPQRRAELFADLGVADRAVVAHVSQAVVLAKRSGPPRLAIACQSPRRPLARNTGYGGKVSKPGRNASSSRRMLSSVQRRLTLGSVCAVKPASVQETGLRRSRGSARHDDPESAG